MMNKFVTIILVSTIAWTINCDPKPDTYVKPKHIDAFKSIDISNNYIDFNPRLNQILVKNVGFGPFGASQVDVVLQNVASSVRGLIEFRLDGDKQEPIANVSLSNQQLRISGIAKPNGGVHDLYVTLPNGLPPSSVESFAFTSDKPKPDQYYYIVQHYSENALSLNGLVQKTPLVQLKLRGQNYQQFRFPEVRKGVYKIISKLGQALQVKFSEPVELVDVGDSQFQTWLIEPSSEGVVRLMSAVATGYYSCMAIQTLSKDVGVVVNNDVCKGSLTEYWWLIPAS